MKLKPARDHSGVVVRLGEKDDRLLAVSQDQRNPTVFALQRILVPVDFSSCSRKALTYALPFARQFGASVTLLYIIPSYYPIPELGSIDYAAIEGQMRETGQAQLDRIVEEIASDRIAVNAVIRTGSPHTEIAQAAKDLNVDLIVLSTHGRTGFKHVVMGSTAEHVVRYAPCPVLVVREQEHEFVNDSARTAAA